MRPHGMKVPATQKLVEALEARAQTPIARAPRSSMWGAPVRPMLARTGERMHHQALLMEEIKAAKKARRKKKKKP